MDNGHWTTPSRALGMARVWRGRRYGAGIERKKTVGVETRVCFFFLEDLDALYAEYRSFQRFPSSDFQTLTGQLARPSAERQALAGRLLYM